MLRRKQIKGRVLFVGQCYYNPWYLSRELRKLGWKADVLNADSNEANQIFYHGEDFRLYYGNAVTDKLRHLFFYLRSLFQYDIYHFCNKGGIMFGGYIRALVKELGLPEYSEIRLLKKLGKKIVYSNNGCLDGVSQSAFRRWPGPEPVCDSCRWRDEPQVCSDRLNLAWGKVRNELADFQCTLGGNRADYNDWATVHEVPEFYCLDPEIWRPDLPVPPKYQLDYPLGTIKLYHSVGLFEERTVANNRNIKSTHIYIPLVDRLKAEGYPVEMVSFSRVPNMEVRFYQVQADIFLDMLTFGFFGATAREAMMLGKPVICYLRPQWLESMRREVPQYVEELPIVTATPETVYEVLRDLLTHPEKCREIGRRGREFALKWHSAAAGARRLGQIYSELLQDRVEKQSA